MKFIKHKITPSKHVWAPDVGEAGRLTGSGEMQHSEAGGSSLFPDAPKYMNYNTNAVLSIANKVCSYCV